MSDQKVNDTEKPITSQDPDRVEILIRTSKGIEFVPIGNLFKYVKPIKDLSHTLEFYDPSEGDNNE